MQNIIEKIQSGDITNNQLLKSLTTYENKTVDEYNEVIEALEDRNTKLDEQCHVLEKQHQAIQKQQSNEKTLIKNVDDLKKQSVAFQLSNKTNEKTIAVLRKEAKAAKEQQKRNLAAAKIKDSKIKKLESELAKVKATGNQLGALHNIYDKGDDVLLVYPTKLTLGVDGQRKEQACLLYTNRLGAFVTVFLDNDNEVAFSAFVNDRDSVNERTLAQIDKHCMKPSPDAAAFAEQWLIRINIQQKGVIRPVDLTNLKG